MTSIGIDPSLSNLAVCVVADGPPVESSFSSECPKEKTLGARVARFRKLVNSVAIWLRENAPHGVVFLEGYSFGSKGAAILTLAEFGMYLRCRLLMDGYTVVEVPPGTLKKFAANNGNAKKAAVVSALSKRYDRDDLVTDDKADAFGLAMLGAQVLGTEEPQTEFQRKAADNVRALYEAELESPPW